VGRERIDERRGKGGRSWEGGERRRRRERRRRDSSQVVLEKEGHDLGAGEE
jgi:hypothetical protein